jgi:hypothetical protein
MEASMCSCSFPDAEPLRPYRETEHKARKDYVCCECREVIPAGSLYQKITGHTEGGWSTFRTCIPCSRIRRNFCAPIEELNETVRDALGIDLHGNIDPAAEEADFDNEETGAALP